MKCFQCRKLLLIIPLFGLFFLVASLFSVSLVEAASSYQPYTGIPGQETTGVQDFPHYLTLIYKFGVTSATILAIFMISLGAFNYIVTSAGNASKMANAKDMIFNAIYGLILVMIAWIILFIINPDLIRGEIKLDAMPSTRELISERSLASSVSSPAPGSSFSTLAAAEENLDFEARILLNFSEETGSVASKIPDVVKNTAEKHSITEAEAAQWLLDAMGRVLKEPRFEDDDNAKFNATVAKKLLTDLAKQ